MKVSDFFKEDVSPLLLGAFYSRYIFSNDNLKIYTEVSYKISKFAWVMKASWIADPHFFHRRGEIPIESVQRGRLLLK